MQRRLVSQSDGFRLLHSGAAGTPRHDGGRLSPSAVQPAHILVQELERERESTSITENNLLPSFKPIQSGLNEQSLKQWFLQGSQVQDESHRLEPIQSRWRVEPLTNRKGNAIKRQSAWVFLQQETGKKRTLWSCVNTSEDGNPDFKVKVLPLFWSNTL